MKKSFLVTICSLLLPCLSAFAAPGIVSVHGGNHNFSVYTVDPKTQTLGLYWKDAGGSIYNTFNGLEAGLKKQGLRVDFATNAGIYEEGAIPTGLLMIGEKTVLPLNLNPGKGNFFLTPNGVFLLSKGKPHVMTTDAWLEFKHPIDLATQSGPMLVIEGKIHPAFTQGSSSTNIRSGVGVNSKGMIVFAISRSPVNFYDFATFFRDDLDCKNALYLDGAISKFFDPRAPRLPESRENFAAFFVVTSPL